MSTVNISFDNNTKSYLKETFSDDEVTVSEVDIDELNKHISSGDAQYISDIIHDALASMDIEHSGFQWDINVTVEQEIKQ